jgi:hypothetical protein
VFAADRSPSGLARFPRGAAPRTLRADAEAARSTLEVIRRVLDEASKAGHPDLDRVERLSIKYVKTEPLKMETLRGILRHFPNLRHLAVDGKVPSYSPDEREDAAWIYAAGEHCTEIRELEVEFGGSTGRAPAHLVPTLCETDLHLCYNLQRIYLNDIISREDIRRLASLPRLVHVTAVAIWERDSDGRNVFQSSEFNGGPSSSWPRSRTWRSLELVAQLDNADAMARLEDALAFMAPSGVRLLMREREWWLDAVDAALHQLFAVLEKCRQMGQQVEGVALTRCRTGRGPPRRRWGRRTLCVECSSLTAEKPPWTPTALVGARLWEDEEGLDEDITFSLAFELYYVGDDLDEIELRLPPFPRGEQRNGGGVLLTPGRPWRLAKLIVEERREDGYGGGMYAADVSSFQPFVAKDGLEIRVVKKQ